MARESKRYSIHGTLTDVDGRVIEDASVTVWWQRIRESLPVDTGKTNEEGYYQLEFNLPEHSPGNRLVIVEARSERLRIAVRSNPVAPAEGLQVDLQASPEDASAFSRLKRLMQPLMDGLPFEELTESPQHGDVTFLSRELKQTPDQIMQVILAERLGER